MAQTISTNTFGVAKWVVSNDPTQGTHTTLTAATASASSGDVVFIREGTYVENWTPKVGVSYVGLYFPNEHDTASTACTILKGKISFSSAGTVHFSNLFLITNGDNLLSVTGSAASIVLLQNCMVFANDATGIVCSSSAGRVSLTSCYGDTGSSNVLAAVSNSAIMDIQFSFLLNDGNSTTFITCANSNCNVHNSISFGALAYSGSGAGTIENCSFELAGVSTGISLSGTAFINFNLNRIATQTASCLTIGAGCSAICSNSFVDSNAVSTNVFAGSGTLNYGSNVCGGTATNIAGTLTANHLTVL